MATNAQKSAPQIVTIMILKPTYAKHALRAVSNASTQNQTIALNAIKGTQLMKLGVVLRLYALIYNT